jgi:hypothetical protein
VQYSTLLRSKAEPQKKSNDNGQISLNKAMQVLSQLKEEKNHNKKKRKEG